MARCGCSSFFQHCAEAESELVLWFTPWLCDLGWEGPEQNYGGLSCLSARCLPGPCR